MFERVRQYFGAQSESIPMSFVLGFYVSLVVKRWWEQYKLLPWPDTLALFISAGIPGAVSSEAFTVRMTLLVATVHGVVIGMCLNIETLSFEPTPFLF